MVSRRNATTKATAGDKPSEQRSRVRRIAIKRPDGTVQGYLTAPDPTDPVYQAKIASLYDRWEAALDRAARESGMSHEDFMRELGADEE